MKYLSLFRNNFEKRSTFTISEVKKVLGQKKISAGYVNTLLNHLSKKGEIKRITKGVYTFKNEIEVVGFAFPPFYYGLQEALSLRKMWDQETNPVVITSRKIRTGIRKFLGNNYLIKRINRKMFFGFEMIPYYDMWIPVSDLEKTLIDFVYFKLPINQEVLADIKKQIKTKRLDGYLNKAPKWVKRRVRKVLGKSSTF
ncbi:MAG TPA: hypothetical protein VI912_05245 [Candidatus Bilamarchaeaceae archaeon]|nr:hypothetical protein [Candidatus Bilamarchaeaceae archaeon]